MARLLYNNSIGTITDNPLAIGATTVNFAAAPSWATLTGSDYIPLVLEPPAGSAPSANFEVVHVTAYTAGATSATIARGQEGTTAVAHATGSTWTVTDLAIDLAPIGKAAIITGAGTVATPVELYDATAGAFARTLPTAVGFTGVYFLKAINTNAHAVTLGTTGGQTIDGASTITLGPAASGAQYLEATVVSDGANWRTV